MVEADQAARLLRDAVDKHDAAMNLNGEMGTFVYLSAVLILTLYDQKNAPVRRRVGLGRVWSDWRAIVVAAFGVLSGFATQAPLLPWIRGGAVALVVVSLYGFVLLLNHEA